MIDSAKKIIHHCDALMITAGAGMGVDSGLPDFRGVEGFWREYPVIRNLGYRFEEMANPKWFKEDPSLAWAFYGHRLNLYKRTTPHGGFYKLLEFIRKTGKDHFIFTSNVDGHFQKTGFEEVDITEIHGSIHHLQCSNRCSHKIYEAGDLQIKIDEKNFKALSPLPTCPDCGSVQRPNILMFADWEWISDRTDKQQINLQKWLDSIKIENKRLTVIEFGAGTAVPTVRRFGETLIHTHNASLVRVNPRDFETPQAQIAIKMNAKEAIFELFG